MTVKVKVTVENLNEEGGLFTTPAWVAAHDGSFDFFDQGTAASSALESLAEDGNLSGIQADFASSGAGTDGVIFGTDGVAGIFDPEESASLTLDVNPMTDQYFSFSSMVIPSNDAFVGNDNAMAYRLFDDYGNFVAEDIIVEGSEIWDAGTEQNTELDAAFLNQSGPNTGLDENGVVSQHQGFNGSEGNPSGDQNILGGTTASGAVIDEDTGDFTQDGFDLLKISFDVYSELDGTESDDIFQGTKFDDIVTAYEGDDVAFVGEGDDTFFGGEGEDIAFGGSGDDTLWGGEDDDVLSGGDGDDRFYGEDGDDIINGGHGTDIIRAGEGDDVIHAGAGDDVFISGGAGDDIIFGDAGADLIAGGTGDDMLYGGSGADTLLGGMGEDSFYITKYSDSMMGAKDMIQDFQVGLDDINLVELGTVAASSLNITHSGANLYEVSIQGTSTVFDVNTTGGVLTASDFVLAA